MLGAVWNAASATIFRRLQWSGSTDNGSMLPANETRQFARMLGGLEPKNTAVWSPESNGIAESFVKTIKRDYISKHAQTRRVKRQQTQTLQRRSAL